MDGMVHGQLRLVKTADKLQTIAHVNKTNRSHTCKTPLDAGRRNDRIYVCVDTFTFTGNT